MDDRNAEAVVMVASAPDPPKRPVGCSEPNCKPLLYVIHNPDIGSTFCYGVRKSRKIKGKTRALRNAPCDVILNCVLIGKHSEACGQHKFVLNMHDFELIFRHTFAALDKLGILDEIICRALWSVPPRVRRNIRKAFRRRKHILVGPGTKYIRFFCSCGEEFLRVHNDENGGKWYAPSERDEIFFKAHRRLGHKIKFQKHRAKKGIGKANCKKPWQDYPAREWKGRGK